MEPVLPLNNMADRHPGLTPAVAGNYLEAARVCLDRHHESPQEFMVIDEADEKPVHLEWECTDSQCQAAWDHRDDATRDYDEVEMHDEDEF